MTAKTEYGQVAVCQTTITVNKTITMIKILHFHQQGILAQLLEQKTIIKMQMNLTLSSIHKEGSSVFPFSFFL
jgi:hypothetical protein